MQINGSGLAKWVALGLLSIGLGAAQAPIGEANRFIEVSNPSPATNLHSGRGLWIASVAALAAANVADARASWNKSEANQMLAGPTGSFGARGAAVKAGVNGAWIVGQVIAIRRSPRYRTLAIINLAAASILGATAYRNQRIGPTGGAR